MMGLKPVPLADGGVDVENDPDLEFVTCDECGEKALPARKEGLMATRGFQCQSCGEMY